MDIWKRLKSLKGKQFLPLFKTFIFHPLAFWPTFMATRETMKTCNALFGTKHNQNNKYNAFRHALWSYRIAEQNITSENRSKAVAWSKKITDLHEKLAPNHVLARKMDVHNNEIGRQLFLEKIPSEEIIPTLKKMMEKARKITSVNEAHKAEKQLVFMEEKS